jgi:hypothetical protein
MCLRPVIVMFFATGEANPGRDVRRYLRRKENFACIRIFDGGSRRKTENLDVACIWSERTRNKTWFTRNRSSIR